MKKVLFLSCVGMTLLCGSVVAQKTNTDSLKLVAQISADQLKLGTLQNMIEQKTKNKQQAATNAQTSANNNADAAEKLTTDPDDKKLAKKADSKAGVAKSDSRKARQESGKLDDLNKAIMDLKTKIAVEQAKLSVYSPTVIAAPTFRPIAIQGDTIGHP
jgi:hypothetical protein